MDILVGNSFPMSLIRRRVTILPESFERFSQMVKENHVISFWGHLNSLQAVNSLLGVDLTPASERPTIVLDDNGYPSLMEKVFHECWIATPCSRSFSRPQIGEEIKSEEIARWQFLRIVWDQSL